MPSIEQTQARTSYGNFDVFTYTPPADLNGILMVFHGNGRDAEGYCASAIDLAEERGLQVVAPLFDEDRFPSARYHRGGLEYGSDPSGWTVGAAAELARVFAERLDRTHIPIWMFGHSAGGQFLSRVAAFAPDLTVERYIIANPSTYVIADDREDMPYGFEVRGEGGTEERDRIRQYLRMPITIYLGTDDIGSKDLAMSSAAQRQGDNRLDRAVRTYEAARQFARQYGCEFAWRLVFARDVGHTGGGMLRAPEATMALGA